MEKLTLKEKIHIGIYELVYWYFRRPLSKVVPFIARKLPKKLKYFVIIDGMVSVEPSNDPSSVTGLEMLEHLEPTR